MPERDVRGAVKAAAARVPVRKASASDEVFERLAGQIFTGELSPGSALPPERELGEQFEVSRIIVRQATHRLAEIGLLRVKQGGASVVCDPAEAAHPTASVLALRWSRARKRDFMSLCERQLLGGYPLLVLAEPRITHEQAAELAAIVDAHALAPDDLAGFEERFWTRVADIGENPFYRRETRFWFGVLKEQPGAIHPAMGTIEQRLALYRELVRRLGRRENAAQAYTLAVELGLAALHAMRDKRQR